MELIETIAWIALGFIPMLGALQVIGYTMEGRKGRVKLYNAEGGETAIGL